MKLRLLWVILFILVFWNPWHGNHEWFVAWGLAFLGFWTAWDRYDVIRHLRGAFSELQKINVAWHQQKGLAEERGEEIDRLNLEHVHLQAQSDLRALVIQTFLSPQTVDAVLNRFALQYEEACKRQRDFLERMKVVGGHTSDTESDLSAADRHFEILCEQNTMHGQDVVLTKAKFWKAHDLVSAAIQEGILEPGFAVRPGDSFTKYLPPKEEPK